MNPRLIQMGVNLIKSNTIQNQARDLARKAMELNRTGAPQRVINSNAKQLDKLLKLAAQIRLKK